MADGLAKTPGMRDMSTALKNSSTLLAVANMALSGIPLLPSQSVPGRKKFWAWAELRKCPEDEVSGVRFDMVDGIF